MIIYGFRTVESTVGGGGFHCPCCRCPQGYRHLAHNRWFTLYFIPVLPLGRLGEQVECQSCFSRFAPEVLFESPMDAPLMATIVDDAGQEIPGIMLQSPQSPSIAQPPGFPPPGFPPRSYQPQQTSALATISMILGLLSPVLLCACGLSLFSSLGAIVSGHWALANIKRSSGRLIGQGQAITGLVLGYVLLIASLGMWVLMGPPFLRGWNDAERQADAGAPRTPRSADDRLHAAEMHVLSAGDGVATGNTPRAKELAAEYSELMQATREALFTKGRERKLSLSRGQFVVHCELHPDSCAFIVHVPGYRDFTRDAKEVLEEAAWRMAQLTVGDSLEPGDALAVGLRGTLLYGAVLVGEVDDPDAESRDYRKGSRSDLYDFFPVPEPAPDAPSAAETVEAAESPTEIEAQPPSPNRPASDPLDSTLPPGFVPGPFPPGVEPPPGFAPPSDLVLPPGLVPPGFAPPPGVVPPALPPLPPEDDGAATAPPASARSSAAPTRRAPPPPAEDAAPLENVVRSFPDMGWPVVSLAFAPGGRLLAAGKLDRAVLVLDVETGQQADAAKNLDDMGKVTCVAFSFDGAMLLAGGYRGAVRAWRVDSQGRLSSAATLQGHSKEVTALAASPAAAFVLSGSAAGDLVWQSYDNPSQPPRSLAALQRKVLAVHLPQEGLEALATDGRQLIRFDLRDAKVLVSRDLGRAAPMAAAFSPSGEQLAILQGNEVHLWNTATGSRIATFPAGRDLQWSVAVLPHDRGIVTGGRSRAALWRADGQPLASFELGGVQNIHPLALSNDGALLAAIPQSSGQTLTVIRLPEEP